MKQFLILSLFGVSLLPAQTQHYPNATNGTYWLGALGYAPASMRAAISAWAKQRYDVMVLGGGNDTGPNNALTHATTYADIAVLTWNQIYELDDFSRANGYDFENLIIHSSVDMQWGAGFPTANNTFDVWDYNVNGLHQNGLITYASGKYYDVTNSSPITIASTLYVGYMVPFDQMNFTISKAAAGGTVRYSYWNGSSWMVLSDHFTDGTSGLTINGKVSFYPPSDWKRTSVNASRSKYWIQVTVTGATAAPAFSACTADNLSVASGTNNARGWNPTDSHRINVGTPMEYNPTPPANATAKFRYQARVPLNFWNGYVYTNPSYKSGGIRPLAKFYLYDADRQVTPPYAFNGIFMDDTGRTPTLGTAVVSPANPMTYFDCATTVDGFLADQADMFGQLTQLAHAAHGPGFWVGGNGPLPSSHSYGDYTFIEGFVVPDSHRFICNYTSASCPYDDALHTNNRNDVKYYVQVWDRWAFQNAWAPVSLDNPTANPYKLTQWHYVDQGDRTPIALLAMDKISGNSNTGFVYFGGGIGFNSYLTTDQVFTIQARTMLTANVPANTHFDQPKTFSLASKAGCSGAGRYLRLGDATSGEVVQGEYGRVLWVGQDKTWDFSTETNSYGGVLSQIPNVIIFMYSGKFSSLQVKLLSSSGTSRADWEYWNGTAWVRLPVADGTNALLKSGSVSWTPPGDWATKSESYTVAPPGWPAYSTSYTGYAVRVTTHNSPTVAEMTSLEWLTMDSIAGSNSTTPRFSTSLVYNSYLAGSQAACVKESHLSQIPSPASANVYQWIRWFPAMATDIGTPTGPRRVPWKTGGAPDNFSGQTKCLTSGDRCSDIWRRDFTNAIVLLRPFVRGFAGTQHVESEIDTYSKPIPLGGTYYPLKSDGTTGPGVTSIQLRGLEGAILMSHPITTQTGGPAVLRGAAVR